MVYTPVFLIFPFTCCIVCSMPFSFHVCMLSTVLFVEWYERSARRNIASLQWFHVSHSPFVCSLPSILYAPSLLLSVHPASVSPGTLHTLHPLQVVQLRTPVCLSSCRTHASEHLLFIYLKPATNWLDLIRSFAISTCSFSFSIPMNDRSVFNAATAVVPLPMQLSRTVSPSFVYVRTRYSISSTGFCVGWNL